MELITERDVVRAVAARWKQQYFDRKSSWMDTISGNSKNVYDRLMRLDTETATAADVTAIIGNSSWVEQLCNECCQYGLPRVRVGDEPDYDSQTAYLCLPCAQKAVDAFAEG